MKTKLLIAFFITVFLGCSSSKMDEEDTADDDIIKIQYEASSEVISNPERGFMHTWSVTPEGTSLNLSSLNSLKSENVTIILRLYYLNSFKDSDMSDSQLELIKTDFSLLREAGIKCILRFAYNSDQNDTDAPLTIIERHLDQLKPIVTENADIIAFVQAGFIGSWGEWHTTTNNLTTLANRTAVLNKILETFPEEIKVQVRTPLYKKEIFNYTSAIDANTGYSTTDIARVGFHNDCFLASETDYGTYQNVTEDKAYINQEALFVPTGGETCPPSGIPTASCNTAENEMTYLRWTYLNLDYYGPVLQVWKSNSCFDDFQRDLGYRIILRSSELQDEAILNGDFQLSSVLKNVGFAPVYNAKNSFLVFKSEADGTTYKKALNFDVRRVIPSLDFDLEESVSLSGIPAGDYEIFLRIEDSHALISDRTEYAIQLANTKTWDADQGLNSLLHVLTIN